MKKNLSLLLNHILYHTTLKTKLFTVTIITAIIPTVIICIVAFNNMVNIQMEASDELAAMSLSYTEQVLTSYLNHASQTANSILLDHDIQRVLKKRPKNYTYAQQVSDFQRLTSILQTKLHESDVASIRITLRDDLLFSQEGYNYIPFSEVQKKVDQLNLNTGTEQSSYWISDQIRNRIITTSSTPVLTYIKLIRNDQNFDDILGYVCIDLSLERIQSLLGTGALSEDSYIYAIYNYGDAFVCYSKSSPTADLLAAAREVTAEQEIVKFANVNYICHTSFLPNYDWKIVTFLPVTYLSTQRKDAVFSVLITTFLLCAVTMGIIYTFYRINLNRINSIVSGIQKIQNGTLDTRLTVYGNDEYSTIEGNFNYMAEKISTLIDETSILNSRLKEAEIKAIQAQINPHFLYNAINTISWTALDYGATKVSSMLESLAAFYKINLRISRNAVTLGEELELVSRYIEIENMRYMDRIILEVHLPQDMLDIQIPNMILQPIVENSILHGILPKGPEGGTISITGTKNDSRVYLSIADDGIGFDPIILKNIESSSNQSQSYGLFSINERIKLRFGEMYGLSFKNGEHAGAVITLTLPIVDTKTGAQD